MVRKVKPRKVTRKRSPQSSGDKKSQENLAVGHEPERLLAPKDEALFKAFQANLLSLISHELRTPLTGVLSSLTLIEQEGLEQQPEALKEILEIARKNADRLQHALSSLLDLASLESGTFHARLREVDFQRLAREHLQRQEAVFQRASLQMQVPPLASLEQAILGDPRKLGRGIDLLCHLIAFRAEAKSEVRIVLEPTEIQIHFKLKEGQREAWDLIWTEAAVGFQSGVASPTSAFAGTLQSEHEFMIRSNEGLGSELLIVHQIAKLHEGTFECKGEAEQLQLRLKFPEIETESSLQKIISNRIYENSTDIGSVTLVVFEPPHEGTLAEVRKKVAENLYRSRDAVYPLQKQGVLGLVLDDLRPEHVMAMLKRTFGEQTAEMKFGVVHSPQDGVSATDLLQLALERLKSPQKTAA